MCNSQLYKTNKYSCEKYGCPICFKLYSLDEWNEKDNFKFWTDPDNDEERSE